MTTEFRLPDLAEGVAEGEVVAWHVAEGDRVEEDDVLAEVETDKALVEVPSPYAGVVVERCAAAGEVVPVGEVLVRFESDDAVAGEPAEKDEAETGDDGETTGDAESDRTEAGDAGDGRTRPVPAPPSVRRLAREVGVDLAAVDGSGPGGRVTRTDVDRAARDQRERAARGERRRREPGGTDDRAARDHQERAAGGERDEDGERVPAGEGSDTAEPTATERSDPDTGGPRDRTLATPATRRVADELGVDLDRVPASEEREGEAYVTEADVRAYAERGAEHVARTEGPGHEAEGGDDGEPPEAREHVARTEGPGHETEGGDDGEPPEARERGGAPATEAEPAAGDDRRTTEATAAAVEAAAAALEEEVTRPGASDHGEAGGPDERTTPAPPSAAGDVSGERVPYRGVRRTIGERLAESARTVPHATHHDSVDARRLVEVREALNAETDVRLTYTTFVVRAVVSGLAAYPALNAQLNEEAEEIVYRDEYNVGVAVATEAGLMVPVVENADELGVEGLAERIADLAARARDRALAVDELRGGTFTVSNVGAVGGEYATPIVNHPEVAVLALGAIRERPRVVDGEVVARPTLPLSLSIDHRVVDGAVAAAFTNHVMERLREPARVLL